MILIQFIIHRHIKNIPTNCGNKSISDLVSYTSNFQLVSHQNSGFVYKRETQTRRRNHAERSDRIRDIPWSVDARWLLVAGLISSPPTVVYPLGLSANCILARKSRGRDQPAVVGC